MAERNVVVVRFDEPSKAYQALSVLKDCDASGRIVLESAALVERTPVQQFSAEHYQRSLHPWTCYVARSSAPSRHDCGWTCTRGRRTPSSRAARCGATR